MTHRCCGAHTVTGVIANGCAVRQNQPQQGNYLSVGDVTFSLRLHCSAHSSRTTLLVILAICSRKLTHRRRLFFSSTSVCTNRPTVSRCTCKDGLQPQGLKILLYCHALCKHTCPIHDNIIMHNRKAAKDLRRSVA